MATYGAFGPRKVAAFLITNTVFRFVTGLEGTSARLPLATQHCDNGP